MKREILFKAQRADGSGWVFGDLYHDRDFHGNVISTTIVEHRKDLSLLSGSPSNNQWWIEIISETICQFTGLTDKNGTKIFEGDLYLHGESERFVEYRNGNPCITTINKTKTMLLSFCKREELEGKCYGDVTGNIHDTTQH